MLEQETQKSGFWNDNLRAQKVTSQISEMKEEISSWEKLLDDSGSLTELSQIGAGSDLKNEAEDIEKRFQNLERISLFSGKYDVGDAILNIYSGAGGG